MKKSNSKESANNYLTHTISPNGITLVALVITIIILLILAGISISQLTGSGLFERAKEAEEKSDEAQNLENSILTDYENTINEYLTGNENNGETRNPENPTTPAISISEAQADYMLTKTVNSTIKDANGNEITVPAGFKIKVDTDTNNATTVDKGIVIIDNNENEFVWIPVGTIYTNVEKTATKTIEFNRYTFDANGNPTPQNDAKIDRYYQELATSTTNTPAKDIEAFKTSVTTNKGYYIGRYEARTATVRTSKNDSLTTLTEKGSDYVYNYVTQSQAAELARNMYNNSNFTSDLINSYAWDTATLFLQTCGTKSTYSSQTSLNTSLLTTGTNNTGKKDMQCNVYDMASNCLEWTTENSSNSGNTCVSRGGFCNSSGFYTSSRSTSTTYNSNEYVSFRPLLYLRD